MADINARFEMPVTTGALRLPAAGDMLSRSALKSEVAKQVRGENLVENWKEKRKGEREQQRSHWMFYFFTGF